MRLLFRFFSLVALVLAVIAGTVDSIQSVSASTAVLTSFGSTWQDLDPSSLTLAEASVEHYIHPYLWNPIIHWVLLQPAFAVFLGLSLVFWMIGFKKQPAMGRFAA